MFDRIPSLTLLLTLSLAGTGCAVAGGGGTARPPARDSGPLLSYGDPGVERVEYRFGDTATVSLEGGPEGAVRIPVEVGARISMALSPSGDGLGVTARFRELEGRMGDPASGPTVVTEEGIRGVLVFTLTPRGEVVLQTLPELTAEAERIVSPASLAREFFPRFPTTPPSGQGATWTDSLSYRTRQGDATLSVFRVLTYTLRGETTMAGRKVLRMTTSGRTRYEFRGTRMGMETRQTLEGPVEGEVLWDPERRIPVSVRTRKRLSGTMELPALGTPPIPLELEGTTLAVLLGS